MCFESLMDFTVYRMLTLFFKSKIYRRQYTQKADEVFPVEGFFQVKDRKKSKDHQGNDLLDDLKLKSTDPPLSAEVVGRNGQAVFKKGN